MVGCGCVVGGCIGLGAGGARGAQGLVVVECESTNAVACMMVLSEVHGI